MGPMKSDHIKQLIVLTGIILSGFHCMLSQIEDDHIIDLFKSKDIKSEFDQISSDIQY
jgi:hypothetical protein